MDYNIIAFSKTIVSRDPLIDQSMKWDRYCGTVLVQYCVSGELLESTCTVLLLSTSTQFSDRGKTTYVWY
jgi:hypothetical protein